jgi:protein arginine N-methyltransferase 6
MLRDRPRMEAYRDAIMQNAAAIRGKTVLDVGCGTGILSMIAAKAGAKAVIAVEASGIAAQASNLVKHNGLSEIVTVLHARMEDVELPDKVDVIISEWMGFYLLHESMLSSVVYARDRWLKDGGLVLPTHATIYACPVSMDEYRKEKVDFWADVCGLDLHPFGQEVAARAAAPVVQCIEADQLLAKPETVVSLDCTSVTAKELQSIRQSMSFPVQKAGQLAGIALWFDCRFDIRPSAAAAAATSRKRVRGGADSDEPSQVTSSTGRSTAAAPQPSEGVVVLSTSPSSAPTHWMQTIVMLGVYAPVEQGETVDVAVAIEQDAQNPRVYSISVNT